MDKANNIFKVDKSNSILIVTKVKNSWDNKKLNKWIKKDLDTKLEKDSLLMDWLDSEKIFCRHKNVDEEDKEIILNGLKRIERRKHDKLYFWAMNTVACASRLGLSNTAKKRLISSDFRPVFSFYFINMNVLNDDPRNKSSTKIAKKSNLEILRYFLKHNPTFRFN